jgi:hypothetical protein
MSELMLINPGRRIKRRAKRRANPAKKRRGRRRMSALQLKYFGKKSQRNPVMAKKRRRSSKRKHARKAVAITVRANPRRRHRRHNPIRAHKRRHYRRNPSGLNIGSFLKNTLMPSAVGAVGALGVNIVLGYLPIPDTMKTGPIGTLVKIAGAVGVGMIASKVSNRRIGEQVTAGAVTVQLYQLMSGMLANAAPALAARAGLAGMDEYPSLEYTAPGMGAYVDSGMGMYMPASRVSTL